MFTLTLHQSAAHATAFARCLIRSFAPARCAYDFLCLPPGAERAHGRCLLGGHGRCLLNLPPGPLNVIASCLVGA